MNSKHALIYPKPSIIQSESLGAVLGSDNPGSNVNIMDINWTIPRDVKSLENETRKDLVLNKCSNIKLNVSPPALYTTI